MAKLIGSPVVAPGVIRYPLRELGLCASLTGARYTTTTEVYPDSSRTTPDECNRAQAAAVCAALDLCCRGGCGCVVVSHAETQNHPRHPGEIRDPEVLHWIPGQARNDGFWIVRLILKTSIQPRRTRRTLRKS
jgi:hypothetical protein